MTAVPTQPTQYPVVREWSGIHFDRHQPLVPRRELRLGDHVQSSHGYTGYIAEVYTAGNGPTGGTTQITIELHRKGSGVFRSERYDATSRIPVLWFNTDPAPEAVKLHAWSMSERNLRQSGTQTTDVAALLTVVDSLRDALSTATAAGSSS